ncbi:MAG: hypothetical protein ACKV0T_22145 [Planctomycetales bacterium]
MAHWFIGTLMIVFCLLFLVWLGTGNQRLRQLLHRPGFLVSLGFLGAIPFGIIAEVAEWGQMPDKFESGFFCNAMVFATMAYFTRPAEPSTPNAA